MVVDSIAFAVGRGVAAEKIHGIVIFSLVSVLWKCEVRRNEDKQQDKSCPTGH